MKNKILSIAVAGLLVIGQLQLIAFADSTSSIKQTDGKDTLKPIYSVTLSDSDFKVSDSPAVAAPSDITTQSAINLTVGQTTSISQNEGGIAGITWKYTIGDNSIVDLKSEESTPPPKGVADGFSNHTWTFVAKKSGTTEITFNSRFETKVYTIKVSAPDTTVITTQSAINLTVGQTTSITQNEGGFAGFIWKYTIGDSSIVDLKSEETIPPPKGVIDGFSKHTWTFEAKKAGTTDIIFTSGIEKQIYTIVVSDPTVTTTQSSINLTVGQTTSITQNEGGKAGLTWKYTIGDNSIVDLKSENTVSPPSVVYDGFSSHTWTFIAKKAGTTDITFTSKYENKVYTIIVSDPKADKKVDMKVGERLSVQLKQNLQTGKWQSKIQDSSIIGLESESSPSINPIFSSIHKWVFRAKEAGSTTITFTCKQRTINVLVNVTDIAVPTENVIKLKVGGTTTISDPMGGLVGMKHTLKILDTSIIDITDHKVIPPPEGSYDLPNTEVWTITAKKPGTTSIIDTYTTRAGTSNSGSKTYTVIVTAN